MHEAEYSLTLARPCLQSLWSLSVVLVEILPAESMPSAVSEFAASSVTELPVLDAFRSL
jgi:hypothetical protein